MQRHPRPTTERLFSWRMIGWSVFQGGAAFAMLASLYLVASNRGMPEPEVRALIFFALIAIILALVLINRSFSTSLVRALTRGNTALRYVLLAIAAVSAAIMFLPAVQRMLRFEHLRFVDLLLAGAVGAVLLVLLEALKPFAKRAILGVPTAIAARSVLSAP